MTVHYPEEFADSPAAGFDGLFDWDFLFPAFKGTKIQPMGLDAVVERRGKFLVFETKNKGVPIPLGQKITLEALVMKGDFTVIILRDKDHKNITGWEVWWLGRKTRTLKKEYQDGDSNDLINFVARWFEAASA